MQRRGKDLRIGDPERERAITLLSEHLTAARLDIHEYDQRCSRVAAARFTSELQRIFEDLPGPVPTPQPVPDSAPSRQQSGGMTTAVLVGVGLLLLVVVARQIWLLPIGAILAAVWFVQRGR